MLNDIQIQELLKRLPDQQLAPMAQGASPNVNPQDVMMEMNRRAQLRKANEMKPSGIAGLSKGGMAKKKYAEGGLASLKALPINPAYLNKEEQLLKDRADRMKAAEMGLSLEEYRARMKTSPEAQRAIDMIPKDTVAQMLADQKKIPPMPKTPMPSPESLPPAFAAATAGSNAGIGTLPTTQPTTQPTPQAEPGIPMAKPAQPDPRMNTAMGNLSEEQLGEINAAKKRYSDIAQQINAVRSQGIGEAPNMEGEKVQAFYKGLLAFGASLATTGVYAVAGKEGVDVFSKSIMASEARKKEFMQKSSEVAIAALESQLAEDKVGEAERARIIKDAREAMKLQLDARKSEADLSKTQADTNKTLLESKEIPADSKSRRRLQEAQADYYESGGSSAASSRPKTLMEALEKAGKYYKDSDPGALVGLTEDQKQQKIAKAARAMMDGTFGGGSVPEPSSSARRYKVDLQGNVISP